MKAYRSFLHDKELDPDCARHILGLLRRDDVPSAVRRELTLAISHVGAQDLDRLHEALRDEQIPLHDRVAMVRSLRARGAFRLSEKDAQRLFGGIAALGSGLN